jgi:hypothetical protein
MPTEANSPGPIGQVIRLLLHMAQSVVQTAGQDAGSLRAEIELLRTQLAKANQAAEQEREQLWAQLAQLRTELEVERSRGFLRRLFGIGPRSSEDTEQYRERMRGRFVRRGSLVVVVVLALIVLMGLIFVYPTVTGSLQERGLEVTQTTVDIVQKLFTIAAIIIGGIWTYFNFFRGRTYRMRLEATVSGKIVTFKGSNHLIADISLKNVGLSKVEIEQQKSALHVLSYEFPVGTRSIVGATWKDLHVFPVFESHHWIEPGEAIEEQRLMTIPANARTAFQLRLEVVSKEFSWAVVKEISWTAVRIVLPSSDEHLSAWRRFFHRIATAAKSDSAAQKATTPHSTVTAQTVAQIADRMANEAKGIPGSRSVESES